MGLMDKLHYDYTNSGNRLNYVSDNIATNEAEEGFKELSTGEGTTDYAYDDNGNLTKTRIRESWTSNITTSIFPGRFQRALRSTSFTPTMRQEKSLRSRYLESYRKQPIM